MKNIIIVTLLVLGAIAMFTLYEKPDYQHPGVRSGKY